MGDNKLLNNVIQQKLKLNEYSLKWDSYIGNKICVDTYERTYYTYECENIMFKTGSKCYCNMNNPLSLNIL